MKRLVCIYAVVLLIFMSHLSVSAYALFEVSGDTVVYVTDNGTKYHRSGCGYLKSKHKTTKREAENDGYGPCSRCKPDILIGGYVGGQGGPSGSSGSLGGGSSSDSSSENSSSGRTWDIPPQVKIIVWSSIGVAFAILLGKINERKQREEAERVRQQCLQKEKARLEAMQALVQFEKKENAIRERKRIFEEEKARYTAMYEGKSPEELANLPLGVEIGPDGLPKQIGYGDWGPKFTYYCSPSGKCFHSKEGCSRAYVPIHARRIGQLTRCSHCHPSPPAPMPWYDEYLRIKGIKMKYNIK